MLFSAITVSAALLMAIAMWYISQGKTPYRLLILGYALYAVVEAWLAASNPAQWSVSLFIVLDFWGMFMAYTGLQRARLCHSELE